MNFNKFLVTLVAFCIVETFSVDCQNIALQEAVANIWAALSKQNNFLSIAVDSAYTETSLTPLVANANVPYVINEFKNNVTNYCINSSAFVLLGSFKHLVEFNERVILPVTFSMQQQLVIHCQDATFDKLAMLKTSRTERPIIQNE